MLKGLGAVGLRVWGVVCFRVWGLQGYMARGLPSARHNDQTISICSTIDAKVTFTNKTHKITKLERY